ncbi:MAG TPA: thymidine phosphorylase, partial [Ignavibacteria bacterium]|nr:thymidine phosphorylase [Ignavibacteria bacterium]
MNPVEIIKKKRNGEVLTEEEINYFISHYVKGKIPDYQKSALLMTIYFRGLNDAETLGFVKAFINSGERVNLSHINKPKVDKHSTGGVGDKTSIILAPLVACFDVVVPMMSGRGLGHTGGTLDKLESIPGFNVHLSIPEFVANLEKLNVSMIGQTDTLTPADKKIYALRDVTATVENVGLITASITSKKIAEGSEGIVYDVKVGNGSTLPTYDKSKELASKLLKTSRDFGQKAIAILTDMSSPLGYAIGNWVEILECIEIMNPKLEKSKLSEDLIYVTLYLAGAMLMLAGKCDSIEEGMKLSAKKLASGECFEKFIALVEIQGGDSGLIKSPENYPKAKFSETITADSGGYIAELDALTFGLAAVNLGCGRKTVEDKIDYSSAIILNKRIGDEITAGEVVCSIYGETQAQVLSTKAMLLKGIKISKDKPEIKGRIIEVIN